MLSKRTLRGATVAGAVLASGVLLAGPALADTYATASVSGCWAQVDKSGSNVRIRMESTVGATCYANLYVGSTVYGPYKSSAPGFIYYGPWHATGGALSKAWVQNGDTDRSAWSSSI